MREGNAGTVSWKKPDFANIDPGLLTTYRWCEGQSGLKKVPLSGLCMKYARTMSSSFEHQLIGEMCASRTSEVLPALLNWLFKRPFSLDQIAASHKTGPYMGAHTAAFHAFHCGWTSTPAIGIEIRCWKSVDSFRAWISLHQQITVNLVTTEWQPTGYVDLQ